MKVIVVGMGIQGHKRQKFAGEDFVASVDPVKEDVDYKNIEDVPLADYDAALVCTPDESKFELLSYLLKNKKHVLVEKPILEDNPARIQTLLDLARENKVCCYTAYNHRFEPHFMRVKEVLESGKIGQVYKARLFYGNGTARDVRNSPWRDKGMGVLADLGSHLLDTVLYWFGDKREDFKVVKASCFENKAFDNFSFHSENNPYLHFEMSLMSWRNSFALDLYGEKGSLHVDCLCKWGPSHLTIRQRKLPSGRPEEEVETLEMSDPTWEAEYKFFKEKCQEAYTNLDNDLWINKVLHSLYEQTGGP